MERDYGREIDELKELVMKLMGGRMDESKGRVGEVWLPESPDPSRNIHKLGRMHPDARLGALMEEMSDAAEARCDAGSVTYLGVFASGGRQSNWVRKDVSADGLLGLAEGDMAAKVLACVGSPERLRMLLALLKAPRTVAQLVEQCGFSSTGQVYHHLKPLLAADLAKEDEHERGSYVVVPHRVQGIVMVLAGIGDLLDATYTAGNWQEGRA